MSKPRNIAGLKRVQIIWTPEPRNQRDYTPSKQPLPATASATSASATRRTSSAIKS
ncbi:MAG: hypothetical protein LBU27_01555 [Candidatus Peribacteria bacterium]|nr:hypothetical protein [Candidatus Peribacteria bacterium]